MWSKYGYSPRDILFLQSISRVATFLGIIPSYDYKNRKLTYKNLYRCFTLCILCVVTSCLAVSLYQRFVIYYKDDYVTLSIVDPLVDVIGLVLYVTSSLGSSFWNMRYWDKLVIQLSKLEGPENLNTRGTKNSTLRKNPLVYFIGGCLLYFVSIVCQFFHIGSTVLIYYIMPILLHYTKYVLIDIIYNITLSIEIKYKDLNNMLLEINSVTTVTSKSATKLIKKVRILYLKINSVIDTFNSFFGWPLLLLVAHSFAEILTCLSLLATNSYPDVPSAPIVISYHLIMTMGFLLRVISGCDNVLKASHNFVQNCFELRESFPLTSKPAEEIEKLQATFKVQSNISAAGFFEINRSLLLSIFSTATTYLIVVIQFRSVYSVQ